MNIPEIRGNPFDSPHRGILNQLSAVELPNFLVLGQATFFTGGRWPGINLEFAAPLLGIGINVVQPGIGGNFSHPAINNVFFDVLIIWHSMPSTGHSPVYLSAQLRDYSA